ncbi:membrane protein [Streptomyces ruber]|uniref:Membrane protein n=2 Tax=Streptomyces TaxID=1883 RepID=A0A918BLC1_9ACTN|nr:hypothetical protein [Streptomyces ruber]GGQ75715.1 membrane protein [Streptomyces ruber]
MAGPSRLHPEDRADFEAVLELALSTADIRKALLTDPTGRAAGRLRARALAGTDEITAASGDAYGTYLALRSASSHDTERTGTPDSGNLLPALLVLTPLVAAVSAAILLLLGYLLQLADTPATLPGSLVTAGWVLAFVAAVSTLVALAALVGTAVRRRGGPPSAERLEQARLSWHQALLDQGLLPHLRRCIEEDPSLSSSPPQR